MTAKAFAAILHARSTGRGRWQGRCPAHVDRSPSLSIREGHDRRVLVHCSGCALEEILAALGLGRRDLFVGPPPSPEQAVLIQARREAGEQQERGRRRARREVWDGVRKWEAVVNSMGARLALRQEDDALATLFHIACARLHESQMRAETLDSLAQARLAQKG